MIRGEKLEQPAAGPVPGQPDGEHRRIAALRMRLLEDHPFWGYLLMQVQVVPMPSLPAIAATDCVKHIWYNPQLTCHLDLKQLGFVLAHELGHHVYATLQREQGRDRHLWNCATDYAINRIVASIPDPAVSWPPRALYRVPSGKIPGMGVLEILLDARFDGLAAEVIYDRLLQDGGKGLPARGTVRVELGDGVILPNLPDHGGGLDVHIPGELSAEDRERMGDRLRAAVEHYRASESRGAIPLDVSRDFGQSAARVPWRRLLRAFVSQARSNTEYDARRPHRRWLDAGAFVPSWGGEATGLVVVALDTSGSMSARQLSQLCGEIRALAQEVTDLRLVVADARVQETVTLEQLEPWLARGKARSGGGTSHVPVFEWIQQQRLQPECFIGLTDLYSAFPTTAPAYPVVWVVPESHGTAPFGRVVVVG